jgi:hypothetical protein
VSEKRTMWKVVQVHSKPYGWGKTRLVSTRETPMRSLEHVRLSILQLRLLGSRERLRGHRARTRWVENVDWTTSPPCRAVRTSGGVLVAANCQWYELRAHERMRESSSLISFLHCSRSRLELERFEGRMTLLQARKLTSNREWGNRAGTLLKQSWGVQRWSRLAVLWSVIMKYARPPVVITNPHSETRNALMTRHAYFPPIFSSQPTIHISQSFHVVSSRTPLLLHASSTSSSSGQMHRCRIIMLTVQFTNDDVPRPQNILTAPRTPRGDRVEPE